MSAQKTSGSVCEYVVDVDIVILEDLMFVNVFLGVYIYICIYRICVRAIVCGPLSAFSVHMDSTDRC